MIAALLCGRKGSKGLPNKNIYRIFGRPLAWYPLQAAIHSKYIQKVYVSTDSKEIARLGTRYGATIISRPKSLATDNALLEDVLQHGYKYIKKDIGLEPEILVILLCNAATVSTYNIDKGVKILRSDKLIDSVATVALLNQYSPVRAKKIVHGKLIPAIDSRKLNLKVSCDRKCMGDIYFCDASLWIVRPRAMNDKFGQPPFPWMGRNAFPIFQQGGLDVDDESGIHITKCWLQKHGFSAKRTPYKL